MPKEQKVYNRIVERNSKMYTHGCLMTKQERKFTLGEVHTKMGSMGEVRVDQSFLDVLGIKPGDFITFTIAPDGVVTVTGEKKAPTAKPTVTTSILPTDVSQPALFDTGQPTPQTQRKRRSVRKS